MFGGFAVVTFALVLYVLSKVVLERNSRAISIIKILGYTNREISGLYNTSTAVAVVLCLLISLALNRKIRKVPMDEALKCNE